ncbi:MAG: hypothetical protein ACEQSA_01380 [Weeksellaceae bacterium]
MEPKQAEMSIVQKKTEAAVLRRLAQEMLLQAQAADDEAQEIANRSLLRIVENGDSFIVMPQPAPSF